VSAVPGPGFTGGEALPASAQVAVATLTDAISLDQDGGPLVLVGHSSGGILAHAVSAELERRGTPAQALALLDTNHAVSEHALSGLQPYLLGGGAPDPGEGAAGPAGEGSTPTIDDERLTAMAAYFGLFGSWESVEVSTPTVLLRASQPLPNWDGGEDWRSAWHLPHTVLETPGNHFSMMGEHADSTARLLHEWLLGRSTTRPGS
jgi:thioesterase domain-containing protein